jgi:TatD DNase family protein
MIDTHAHIYSKQFEKDREDMLRRAFEEGLSHIFMPNVDHESIDGMMELELKYPRQCYAMMGLHPCSVDKNFEKELYIVESWLAKRNFTAVGEMGIDLYWDTSFVEQQIEAFKIQANWAKKYQLPLIIHSRSKQDGEAMQLIIKLLQELKTDDLYGILHCFTGTVADAEQLIDLGFSLGIGGVVTYKNSGLDQVVAQIPLENLVVETDCPYLAPQPHRGKRNETAYVKLVVEKIATIKSLTFKEVAEKTSENALKIFKHCS